jgi:hypothetical protein
VPGLKHGTAPGETYRKTSLLPSPEDVSPVHTTPHPATSRRADRATSGKAPGIAVLLAVALLTSLTSLVPAPPAEAAFGRAIEGYASYQGQTSCSPSAKAGTKKLSTWLQRKYPGTGSLGIVRACKVGGKSEHKEGRAFDWRVNARNTKQKKQADAFLKSLLATDRYGNRHALARRMGIMYVIWNKRIWSTSGRGWRAYTGASPHTDHVHISLSWNGARGRTSWYTGSTANLPAPKPAPKPKVTAPKPKVTPKPKPAPAPAVPAVPAVLDQNRNPSVALTVPASGRTVRTSFSLRAGTTYRLAATGTYRYGPGTMVADAHCSWHASTADGWEDRSPWEAGSGGSQLELLVSGSTGWRARSGGTCDSSHVYVRDYKPTRTGPVEFRINDAGVADNAGSLSLRILKAGADTRGVPSAAVPPAVPEPVADATALPDGPAALDETVTVPAAERAGALTTQVLQAGVTYRLTVSGTFGYGSGFADAECARGQASSRWERDLSVDPFHPDADHLDLYVDGRDLLADPVRYSSSRCDSTTHTYRWDYTPERTGRARFAIWDPTPADNSGALTVRVARSSSVRAPQPDTSLPTTGSAVYDETVTLDAAAADGAVTTGVLRKGSRYTVVVTGTWQTGYGEADPECAAVPAAEGWRRDVTVHPTRTGDDLFDLYIDGKDAALWPVDDDGSGCSPTHVYTGTFTAKRHGAVRLALWDVATSDNTGALSVRLVRP